MNEYFVERLNAGDYDELLHFMNTVYNIPSGKSFESELPKMWRRTDEAMGKHIAIRIDGKIAATVGIYPLPIIIAGQKVLFSTVGNVGTLPEFRNLGLMKTLMNAAMKELETIGADASRLGGERQRYNRYGYETAGMSFRYRLTKKNIISYYDGTISGERLPRTALRFRSVKRNDTETLKTLQALQQQGLMYMLRGNETDFFDTACSWGMQLWEAIDEAGNIVGYLSASADAATIGEQYALTPGLLYSMLLSWLELHKTDELHLLTSPHDTALNQHLNKLCEECKIEPSSNFKIIHWDKVVDALLKLKCSLAKLPKGSLNVGIKGYGTLHLEGDCCVRTDCKEDLMLDQLTATRFLFGPQSPEQYLEIPEPVRGYCSALLPLPLGWNNQERV